MLTTKEIQILTCDYCLKEIDKKIDCYNTVTFEDSSATEFKIKPRIYHYHNSCVNYDTMDKIKSHKESDLLSNVPCKNRKPKTPRLRTVDDFNVGMKVTPTSSANFYYGRIFEVVSIGGFGGEGRIYVEDGEELGYVSFAPYQLKEFKPLKKL